MSTWQLWQLFDQLNLIAGVLYALPVMLPGNGPFLRGIALASFVGFAFAFPKSPNAKL